VGNVNAARRLGEAVTQVFPAVPRRDDLTGGMVMGDTVPHRARQRWCGVPAENVARGGFRQEHVIAWNVTPS